LLGRKEVRKLFQLPVTGQDQAWKKGYNDDGVSDSRARLPQDEITHQIFPYNDHKAGY
jgi:hypothetical protein